MNEFTEGKAYEEDPIIGTYDLPEQQAKRGSAGEGLGRGGVYLANWFPSGEGNGVGILLLFLEHCVNIVL